MKKARIIVVLFLVCFLPKDTMCQEEECEIVIRGKLQDKVDEPRFTVTALERPYSCWDSKIEGQLCRVELPCKVQNAVLSVFVPGFKKYRRNLVLRAFEKRRTSVEIGTVALIPSSLPEVKQIIRSRGPEQSVRFEIILHNKLDRELLVHQFTFEARRDGRFAQCYERGTVVFQVANQLLITAKEGQFLDASGEFRELLRSPDFAIQAKGEIDYAACGGGTTLSLKMPTAFTIPSKGYSAIEVRLPSHFDVQFVKSSGEFDSFSSTEFLADVLSYDHYIFPLKTSEEEELDLVGTYSEGRRELRERYNVPRKLDR
jgi:hypothetical protein